MDATQVAQLMTGVAAILTFAVVGVWFGWRRDKREAREFESKAKQQAAEAERRAHDLTLALEQAERERIAFDEERQARPSVESRGGPAVEGGDLVYTFRVKNRGKVFADNVTLWLVDAFGAQLCEPRHLAQMLEPSDTAEIALNIPPGATPPLRVYSRWRDMSGLHERESWVEVPAPPP